VPVDTLSAKGRQTREAIERAARKLFAERGFHGTTLADITIATLSRIWKKTPYGF
jgi:AcrR family transcriptional regulator